MKLSIFDELKNEGIETEVIELAGEVIQQSFTEEETEIGQSICLPKKTKAACIRMRYLSASRKEVNCSKRYWRSSGTERSIVISC